MPDKILRKLVSDIIATNEIGNVARSYRLSHAQTPKSGFSVGTFQLDLASRSGARNKVKELLEESDKFEEAEMIVIIKGLETKGNSKAIDPDFQTRINAELSSSLGKEVVNALDADQLDEVMGFINHATQSAQENPRYETDSEFKAFSDSDVFKCLMGDNSNQFGGPNTFGKYIKGDEVTVGGLRVQLDNDPWNVQAFANYEAKYAYTRNTEKGANDMRRRRRNAINILADQNAIVPAEKLTCLEIIQDTYKAE